MQIIPALYIKNGRLAAYCPGDYENMDFLDQDPYELLAELDRHNVQRILLVDIDASLASPEDNRALIGSLANTTVSELEVAGGIRHMDYLKSLQYAGVDYFVLGSALYDNFELVETLVEVEHVKADRLMIAIDVQDGRLITHGWTDVVEDLSPETVIEKCVNIGINRFVITAMNSENPDASPDLEFYRRLLGLFPDIHITASGHVRTFADIDDMKEAGIAEVIVGNEIFREPALMDEIFEYNKTEQEQEED